MKPLCFVLMPFGSKPVGDLTVDFDAVYQQVLKPAIVAAQLEPIRADEEKTDGIIHKPMFERLLLCPFAIADLTGANPNVYYELGVRHAQLPHTTVMTFANTTRLPFDVSLLRGYPYGVDENGRLNNIEADKEAITQKLLDAITGQATDSPIHQLLPGYPDALDLDSAEAFADYLNYYKEQKQEIHALVNGEGSDADKATGLLQFEKNLEELEDEDTGVLLALVTAYKDVKAYDYLVALADRLPAPVQRMVKVQEDKAFALNRMAKSQEAEEVLLTLIKERGASSETYGLLGRIYKDRYMEARQAGKNLKAKGALRKALEAYQNGFEEDIRDFYPGVNAVTLMYVQNADDPQLKDLVPVVRYAVQKSMEQSAPDYWDYATLFDLALIAEDYEKALTHLEDAQNVPEIYGWMVESSLNTLLLLKDGLIEQGKATDELEELEGELRDWIKELGG